MKISLWSVESKLHFYYVSGLSSSSGLWLLLWPVESKLHLYYVSGLSSPWYVAFTLVNRVKAALILREWAELAGVCSFHSGQ